MRATLVAIAVLFAPRAARAGEMIIPLSGSVPAGAPDHVFVDFEVPEGTVEIEVRHDDLSDGRRARLGPRTIRRLSRLGRRQQRAGDRRRCDAASRSYVAGADRRGDVAAGDRQGEVVDGAGAQYDVEIVLRSTADARAAARARAVRRPAAPLVAERALVRRRLPRALARERRRAAGRSTRSPTFARGRGLDFVELSAITTRSRSSTFIGDAQPAHPELLFVPGMEFTTYAGPRERDRRDRRGSITRSGSRT